MHSKCLLVACAPDGSVVKRRFLTEDSKTQVMGFAWSDSKKDFAYVTMKDSEYGVVGIDAEVPQAFKAIAKDGN